MKCVIDKVAGTGTGFVSEYLSFHLSLSFSQGPRLQFSPVTVILPMRHTSVFTCHYHYPNAPYFSFQLSLSFSQCFHLSLSFSQCPILPYSLIHHPQQVTVHAGSHGKENNDSNRYELSTHHCRQSAAHVNLFVQNISGNIHFILRSEMHTKYRVTSVSRFNPVGTNSQCGIQQLL